MMQNLTEDSVKSLKEIVGEGQVSTNLSDRFCYSQGALPSGNIARGIPDVVVMPKSAEEVSKILKLANEKNLPVVPRGCGESQSGANIAQQGGIMMDMALMNKILKIDADNMVVVAEGGCSVYKIMKELDKMSLRFPFGPVFTCGPLIGSAVATNATGDFMCRYGRLGDLVVGLEVVLPTGEIVTLGSGAYKSGYGHYHRYTGGPDLIGLLVNSVGTLGVMTKVAVRVLRKPPVLSYMTYGWTRNNSIDLAKAMYELQRDEIYDIHLWNSWAFAGPSAYFSFLGDSIKIPNDIHFVSMMVLDALSEEEIIIKEKHSRKICGIHKGRELGDISQKMLGPPSYIGFGTPAISRREAEAMGAKLTTRSSATYFYCPLMKFPDIYDLWEETCRKYDYWNERYYPAWLSWADRNAMNPYPMIVDIPITPEELDKHKRFWLEFNLELTKRGCPQYAVGPTMPKETLEELGPAYDFLKKIKRLLDPNNIMNPGVLL